MGKYVHQKKLKLNPASFANSGIDRKLIKQLSGYGQNLKAVGPNELAIDNIIALVISELETKPAPEAYMGYALYDADSNRYEVEDRTLRKCPADIFSEGPACRAGY